ncbi:MAG: DUF2961 domain-containing protein [Trueperaceae bacterium]|nr:DUF2961 domain-containing protein [Trueperaceae bacterium]
MLEFTYPMLIERLYNLKRLANTPLVGERAGCYSSFDRRSVYNPDTGLYENWDANDDGTGYIRKEGEGIVAFEQEGPGVIWRVWSALAGSGHIRLFIDDTEKPTVDMPFRDFFERLGEGIPPLNFPQLAPTLSRGRNRFIPIPFNHYCKVVLMPDWGRYYHFTYSQFPKNCLLPSYNGKLSREDWIALAKADRHLANRGQTLPQGDNSQIITLQLNLKPQTKVNALELPGNQAITGVQVEMDVEDTETALRELSLSIYWDGETNPSVWSPLGDFFGTAPGVNLYSSLPLGMIDKKFYSHWYMPFSEGARLELANEGEKERIVKLTVVHHSLVEDATKLLRFHAKWHRDAFLEKSQHNGRDIDWPFLHVNGQGRYCGLSLHVWNRWTTPEEEPASWWYGEWDKKTIDWWWGEGDEKFFVDGEKFPSTFGTGSEDYIGYAWAAEPPFPIFESAYANQPYVELDGNGHTSVNRFHICDEVPFQTSFEGCLEKYKNNLWGDGNLCLYDVVAYWYQACGGEDPYEPLPLSERLGYYLEPQ